MGPWDHASVIPLRKETCSLVRKVQINPRTSAKDLVTMLEETGTKVSISTVNRVLYQHNLKGRSERKKPLLQNCHKNRQTTVCNCTWGQDRTFWRNVLWSDDHPNREARGWQHHVVGVFRCRRDWCTSQNRWHHESGKLCGYIEATSQDISQEVKAW